MQPTRRRFLKDTFNLGVLLGVGSVVPVGPLPRIVTAAPVVEANLTAPPEVEVKHLPRTYHDVMNITDEEEKVMLAAVTASGGESIALYTPDENGFSLNKHVELYPKKETQFESHIDDEIKQTFATPEQMQENSRQFIPVFADKERSQVKAVLAIQLPTDDLGRVQTKEEAANPRGDMHETAEIAQAKMELAQYIVDQHADLFGEHTKAQNQAHHTIEAKKKYFTGLVKAMFKTFPLEEHQHPDQLEQVRNARNVDELHDALRVFAREQDNGSQGSHVLGVSEFMGLGLDAVNKAASEHGQEAIISKDQRDLGVLITLLHDVGKTQFASSFMKGYPSEPTPEEKTRFTDYFIDHNHDHPVLSLITMLNYPEEGLTAAAHHHGLFRYTPENLYHEIEKLLSHPTEELKQKVGAITQRAKELGQAVEDRLFNEYSVLEARTDIKPDELPPLSRMMRVADVSEAISGRVSIPLAYTLVELEKKVVAERNADKPSREKNGAAAIPAEELEYREGDTYEITPDTIDPDYLCFMIDHGVFDKYGQIRDQENGGEGQWKSVKKRGHKGEWSSEPGDAMYDPQKLKEEGDKILKRYHWQERKAEVEERIMSEIAESKFIQVNLPEQEAKQAVANSR